MSRILGLWSGHDASFCVLNDGVVEMHSEAERHTRVKEGPYDSIKLFYEHCNDLTGVVAITTCQRDLGIKAHADSWDSIKNVAPLHVVAHHQSHAANAFFSSNFRKATVITIDGGGIENESNYTVGASVWAGDDTKIELLKYYPLEQMNVGGVWSRCTRCIFRYESGAPYGNACGTVMALAALGDPQKYFADFYRFLTSDLGKATPRAPGHIPGMSVHDPREPKHPFLGRWRDIADASTQDKYDMAASLQLATEDILRKIITEAIELNPGTEHLCVSGGVALNSVAMGKVATWFPRLKGIYVPPVPYDGGLTIGAAQYVWHHVMGKPRVTWTDNVSPYLGQSYSKEQVEETLSLFVSKNQINVTSVDDGDVIELLDQGNIVSVFNGRAESGRRALGNRSILADPRDPKMKDRVNEKVKHRQAFRPFAPSVLREEVKNLFVTDCDSPYMGFVLKFKDEVREKLPAVVHFDGSARLQTVTKNDNPWYYQFIKLWKEKTGFGIILNTSLNDREPICETPLDTIKCFLGTDIDFLYLPEFGILVARK